MEEFEEILTLGVDAYTGLPISTSWDGLEVSEPETMESLAAEHHLDKLEKYLDVIGDFSANELGQVGWGLLFPSTWDKEKTDGILEQLSPLTARRKAQVSEPSLFKIFRDAEGYQPGQSALDWLHKRGVAMRTVDPTKGVPYYLLLIGSPEEIPFEFQYFLDIFWGVGRLFFENSNDYQTYAQSVVDYESALSLTQKKEVAIFSTSHDFDEATQLFHNLVAQRLSSPPNPLGSLQKFGLKLHLGSEATKAKLTAILSGGEDTPSLLFTGGHGMRVPLEDPSHLDAQGALVCQDWPGYGAISSDHWFAASDLPLDSTVRGLVLFSFACFSVGTPQEDNFQLQGGVPLRLTERPFLSLLPLTLLARGHALAVFGHVDRAWAYSFAGPKMTSQEQDFRDIMARVLRGDRLGVATDSFNGRWGALSSLLLTLQEDSHFDKSITAKRLAALRAARDDARNYILLGDPAVQLRTELLC